MTFVLGWVLLVAATGSTVSGQQAGLPFQVNSRRTCTSKISLDTATLTGIKRGDETSPCSGNLMYTDGQTAQLCGYQDYGLSDYAAERACYTLGANYYRDTPSFDIDSTRQMRLYRCFSYREQGANSAVSSLNNEGDIFDATDYIDVRAGTGCRDEMADPDAYDCFDTCYFKDPDYSPPILEDQDDCADNRAMFTIICADINECQSGVRDYCTGPFESSCTVRRPCGNNTDCTNHPGSFECSCKNGYKYRSGDDLDPYKLDKGCIDVDECQLSLCDVNAKCVNTVGSYLCWCRDGFKGDGKTCTPITCANLPILPQAAPSGSSYHEYADTVVYSCTLGHRVSVMNLPETLVNYYGYSTTDSFTLTCDEHGNWGPLPHPQCLPVDCGIPDSVVDAVRTGTSSLYEQQMRYECKAGYKLQQDPGSSSSTVTCQADGTWTPAPTCVDEDECAASPSVCPEDVQHCLNTPGSFLCLMSFPDTCELQGGLDLCQNGKCEMIDGKAQCVCDADYKGVLCETPTAGDVTLTLAVVGVVGVGVVLLVLLLMLFAYCCRLIATPRVPPQAAMPPHRPPFPPKDPGFGFRRPPLRW